MLTVLFCRLRFIRNGSGPCWSFSVLLKKRDGSAAPMLLPGILIQATAFPSPCNSSDLLPKLSGVMNFVSCHLQWRLLHLLSPGYTACNWHGFRNQLDAFVCRGCIPCLAAHVTLPQSWKARRPLLGATVRCGRVALCKGVRAWFSSATRELQCWIPGSQ